MVCIGALKYKIVGNHELGSQMDICIPSFTVFDDGGRLVLITCLFLFFLFLSPRVIEVSRG